MKRKLSVSLVSMQRLFRNLQKEETTYKRYFAAEYIYDGEQMDYFSLTKCLRKRPGVKKKK